MCQRHIVFDIAPMKITIYHNPRCSKSRQTLALLEENGLAPEVVEYLSTPPSRVELKKILKMLSMQPRDLMRKNEAEYQALGLDDINLSDEALIDAMFETPKLIERPIVVVNDSRAVIGRPPENVLTIILDSAVER